MANKFGWSALFLSAIGLTWAGGPLMGQLPTPPDVPSKPGPMVPAGQV
jgi:hypothetical protein